MIYQIENKYYIRVAPMRYTEVKFVLKDDDVVIQTTSNKIESNANTVMKEFNFQQEKNNIKHKLINENDTEDTNGTVSNNKYRKRR